MAAVWYRFRAELRTRWRAWLGLALIAGLVGGAVLALAAGARRTDTAHQRFLREQDAYDVFVSLNTSGFGVPTEVTFDTKELERLPQVTDTAETGSFFITLGAGVGALVPPDERIGTEINRFKMLEGRRPDPDDPTEAVIGFELARQYDLEVGNELRVIDPVYFEAPPPDAGISPEEVAQLTAARDRVLAALPDNSLTIVGIEASPGEFPPQIEGTGRYLIHASPALYPLREDLSSLSEGSDLLMVRLENGQRDVDAFVAELERLGAREGIQLTVQRELTDTVDRSLHTQAVALQLLALLTALVGALVVGQLLARLTLLEASENIDLSALGMIRGQRAALGLVRAALIGVVGALVAVAVAMVTSPLFPTGLARIAEPDLGLRLDATVLGLGGLFIVAALILLAAWPVWRASRVASASESLPTRPSYVGRLLADRGVPLPVTTGVRMALEPGRGRDYVPVRSSLVGVTLGVVTLIAALSFGASLAHLLDTPRLYGQTWDFELTTYDDTLATRGLPVLEADDRVDGLAVGNFRVGYEIEGHRVDGLVLDSVDGELAPSVIEGRRPRARDEIALGSRTLRSLGADVGDTVPVAVFATDQRPVPMHVVGRAVFPIFGETGRLGDGAFVSLAGGERISGEPIDPADKGLLVRLMPGAKIDAVTEDLGAEIGGFVFVIGQGKPTDIVNFGRVEATPYILGAILAAIAVATLTHLLASAVRRRRRELAVLKTLGFVRGQVRATVAWQATTLIAVALVVGVPVGLAVGRWIWTLFADNLGVVPEPINPWLAIAILVPVAVLVANLVAAIPAAVAARTKPAIVLRSE
jgi:ABC-type lipoprotein release transport system permease subunit